MMVGCVNDSLYGQAVTLTASVLGNSPGSGTPTGAVVFYDNSAPLGSETLEYGLATFTTSALQVGTHSITAIYGGDVNFEAALSQASLNQVQAVPSPIASVVINDGQQQRSRVTSITVTFTDLVEPSVLNTAFTLTRASDGATVGNIQVSTSTASGNTVATLTVSGMNTEATSLADGNWTLTIDHNQITSGGLPMSSDYVQTDIKRLFGDINGTGTVDSTDLGIFGTTFGLASSDPGFIAGFDSDGNGEIDSTDLGALGSRFGLTI